MERVRTVETSRTSARNRTCRCCNPRGQDVQCGNPEELSLPAVTSAHVHARMLGNVQPPLRLATLLSRSAFCLCVWQPSSHGQRFAFAFGNPPLTVSDLPLRLATLLPRSAFCLCVWQPSSHGQRFAFAFGNPPPTVSVLPLLIYCVFDGEPSSVPG
jgi:hypothetical protein